MTEQPGLGLDTPTQPNPPPRPRYDDPAVITAAVAKLMPAVIGWLGSEWKDEQTDSTKSDLFEALESDPDGYRRAVVLESFGWEPDAALVEILDSAPHAEAHDQALKAWVEANGIKARFAIGDRVAYASTDGTVVWVDHERATYTVQTEDFLESHPHLRGQRGGYVVDFEDCREVTP